MNLFLRGLEAAVSVSRSRWLYYRTAGTLTVVEEEFPACSLT